MVKILTTLLPLGCGYHRLGETSNITILPKLKKRGRNLKLTLLYRSLSLLSSSTQILEDYVYTSNLNVLRTAVWLRHHDCPVSVLLQHPFTSVLQERGGTILLTGNSPQPTLTPKPCPEINYLEVLVVSKGMPEAALRI